MRILHSSDWHLGKTLDGYSRIEEQEKFLEFFVEKSREIQPDIIIIAGDIFDTSNPSAVAEKMFYDVLTNISSNTFSLIVIIPGNHDSPKRLASAKLLARTHGIIIYENNDDKIDIGMYKNTEVLSCNDGVIKVKVNGKIANIMALPYISEARLNENVQDLFDSEEENARSFQTKFEALVAKKEKFFNTDEYNIIIAHLFTTRARLSEDEIGYSIGGAYAVDASAFPKSADYIALGHIHKKQCISGVDKRAYYCGSPIHYNKTEVKTAKKVILQVDIQDDKSIDLTEINVPIYKKIEIWNAESIEDAIKMSEEKSDESSFVYINIKTDRIISNEEIRQIKSNKKDIIEIRPIMSIENIISTSENMLEKSEMEKFTEFYKEKNGAEPTKNIIDRYMDIISYEDEEIT